MELSRVSPKLKCELTYVTTIVRMGSTIAFVSWLVIRNPLTYAPELRGH